MDLLIVLAKVIAGVVGFIVGTLLGSLVAAIWLRLAAQWLRFGTVPYLTAFKSALIANFVVFMLNFSIAANHSFTAVMLGRAFSERSMRPVEMMFNYPPLHFLYATLFGLIITAALFGRTIPSKDPDSRMTFVDALALAALYFALSVAFLLLIGLIVMSLVAMVLLITG